MAHRANLNSGGTEAAPSQDWLASFRLAKLARPLRDPVSKTQGRP